MITDFVANMGNKRGKGRPGRPRKRKFYGIPKSKASVTVADRDCLAEESRES